MARRICLLIAIAAGLCALALLQATPAVEVRGETISCGSMVVDWESGLPVAERHVPACDEKRRELTVLVGLAALVCAGAGSYVRFGGREYPSPPSPGITPTPASAG